MAKPMTERQYYSSSAHFRSEKSYKQYLKEFKARQKTKRKKTTTRRKTGFGFGIW